MAMQTKAIRWAGVAVVLALGVVACTSPTSTELEMGKQIQFSLPTEEGKIDADVKHVLQDLEERGFDEVSIAFRETSDGMQVLDLAIWDPDLDAERAIRELTERHAALRAADVDVTSLHTIVEEPLYAKLSRDVLKIEVGGTETDEELKARILSELAAKGLDGSTVDVMTKDGVTTIDMTAEGDGVHDHDVIELKVDAPTEVDLPVGGGEGEDGVVVEEVEKKN